MTIASMFAALRRWFSGRSVTPSAYDHARGEIGTVEWGVGSNPEVVGYYAEAGHPGVKNDAVAWCAAFVGAMLHRAGIKGTGSLSARSYLMWGEATKATDAKPGDIVIFRRGNSPWMGHVGFFAGWAPDGMMLVLGGNQKDAVSIARYSPSALLGIRRARKS